MEELTVAQKAKQALGKAEKKGTLQGLKRQDVQSVFDAYKAQIAQALPKHLTADRIIQMALDVCDKNPKLKECEASTMIGAVMQASLLGFQPVSQLGECYFVPYAGKVQFQIGYRGWITLARRSNEIKTIFAEAVYSNDHFKRTLGINPDLEHIPAEDNRGEFKGVYAVVHYKSGGYNFVYLTRSEVEKLRLRNGMQKNIPSGAWATDYEDMAKAKAIKKLKAYLPLSNEDKLSAATDEATIPAGAFNNDQSGTLDFSNIPEANEEPINKEEPAHEVE